MDQSEIIRMAEEAGADFEGCYWTATDINLERFAVLAAAAERKAILRILNGIDHTETENPDGWWETSVGAVFGAGILAAISARGN